MRRGILEEKEAEGEAEDGEEGEEGDVGAPEPQNTAVRLDLDLEHFRNWKPKPPMKSSLI